MFIKGQTLVFTKEWTIGVTKRVEYPKGAQVVVNDIRRCHCKCTGSNTWDLIWVGSFYTNSDAVTGGITCSTCKSQVVHEKMMWIPDMYFDPVNKEEVDVDKLQAQLDLMRLLADGRISLKSYEKIIQMTDGDKELLQLGMGIINNKKEEI